MNTSEFQLPFELYDVFSGDEPILPGETHNFTTAINTGFGGMFPTMTVVRGCWGDHEGDATSEQAGNMTISQAPPPRPSNLDSAVIATLLGTLLFGMTLFGFYWGKSYWHHELEHVMKEREPDDLLLWKWYPYYWERDGKMWKNWALWIPVSTIFALIFYTILIGRLFFEKSSGGENGMHHVYVADP